MWSPRLFWKLFLIYAAFQLATVTAFAVLISDWQEREAFLTKGKRLRDAAAILRVELRGEMPDAELPEVQLRISKAAEETHLRITLIDKSGRVLVDSQEDASSMENHGGRKEIIQAREAGQGSSQRYSETVKMSMLYYAKRVDDPQGLPIGFVRVAVPLSEVEAEVSSIQRMLWFVASAVSLGGLMLTYLMVGRALAPVGRLTKAVNAMAEGHYEHRVPVSGQDEFGLLAQSFNRMGNEIEARENQLRDAADRMSAVLGGMIEGVIAFDDQRRILFANEAAGGLFGFSTEELEGRQMRDVVGNSMLRQVVKDLLGDTDTPPEEVQKFEINAADSVIAINSARLPGRPCPGLVLVMHDVTDLRRLETLRQEFVANVSHELKTPLSVILAYAETLRCGALDDAENRERFVSEIERQAHRLSELIQDMLSLARIEAGQEPYEITDVDLCAVVASSLGEHRNAAEAKEIRLENDMDDRPVTVYADEEAMRQILDNLITNAIKYTPVGGTVRVGWKRDTEEGHYVVLEVEDNGIGIPPKHQRRVFERFYRVDKARSREMGGTGLGLSIVKHLAQMQGGSVSLESEPHKGSIFRVRLPAARNFQESYVESISE